MRQYFHQRGSTLIMVLILLILITSVGLYAVRHSMFNLRIATNAQVQTLLMQTTDVALDHLEKHFNANEATSFFATPVGQVLIDGNKGKELQFCFKPTTAALNNKFFILSDFRILTREGPTSATASSSVESGTVDAFCDPAKMFSISRKAIVTQVAVVNPDDPATELDRFAMSAMETDLKETKIDIQRIRVIATSLAPALATSVKLEDMTNCLKNHLMDDMSLSNMADSSVEPEQVKITTVHECLSALGVPVNTQVAEYVVNLNEAKN